MRKYDLLVLGAGSAGMNLIRPLAAEGWKTAMVEARFPGGTCINIGCIPSKTLISSARVMQSARDAQKYGVVVEPPRADWRAMIGRKDDLIGAMRRSIYLNLQNNQNITFYEGKATFTDPQTVEVNGEELTAEKIVIATGARSAIPPVPGLKDINYLTSTSAMEMQKLPKSLFVLGGGIIALEFSQLFARVGVEVTILQRDERLATNLEPEISDEIRRVLEKEGINVKTSTNISLVGSEDSEVYVVDETDKGQVTYRADEILVATGRAPNTEELSLEKVRVETDKRGYVVVDKDFKTSTEGIWAIGDVIGGKMFTHKAWHDALLLSRYFVKGEKIASQNRLVPFAVFTEPEIAGVGMGESEAVQAGYQEKIQHFSFSKHGRALASDKADGFIKLVLDRNNGRILGAHIIGPAAGEIIHELNTAIHFNATVYDLQNMMHIHPTLAEAINNTAWAE